MGGLYLPQPAWWDGSRGADLLARGRAGSPSRGSVPGIDRRRHGGLKYLATQSCFLAVASLQDEDEVEMTAGDVLCKNVGCDVG